MEVSYATSLEDAKKKLPLTLQIKDDIGGETTVDLTWTIENYNPTNPGVYAAK